MLGMLFIQLNTYACQHLLQSMLPNMAPVTYQLRCICNVCRNDYRSCSQPVYRDAMGGIGTPTSDNERTKLEAGTTHLLTIINGYSGKEGLQEAADYMLELLKEFAASKDEELIYF